MAYAVYTSQTWVDGSASTPVSAARLGVIETGNLNSFYAPAVRVFHNANQAITSATATALAFNSERFDTAGNAADTMHDTVTNNSRLTCRYAGKYLITGCVEWETVAAAATLHRLAIRLNGATFIAEDWRDVNQTVGTSRQTVTTIYDMAVNDYVEAIVQQNRGSNMNILVSGNYSPEFSMVRVA